MNRYSEMSPSSRVWVYQCSRKLSGAEITELENLATEFVSQWTSHDMKMKTFFELRHGMFFILMVDETETSAGGCSIDKSVHFIFQLEKKFGVRFTDRMLFAFGNGDNISIVNKSEFGQLVASGKISDSTIVFNTLVSDKAHLENDFEIPFSASWHRKMFTA
jgi:hypothetical protein